MLSVQLCKPHVRVYLGGLKNLDVPLLGKTFLLNDLFGSSSQSSVVLLLSDMAQWLSYLNTRHHWTCWPYYNRNRILRTTWKIKRKETTKRPFFGLQNLFQFWWIRKYLLRSLSLMSGTYTWSHIRMSCESGWSSMPKGSSMSCQKFHPNPDANVSVKPTALPYAMIVRVRTDLPHVIVHLEHTAIIALQKGMERGSEFVTDPVKAVD